MKNLLNLKPYPNEVGTGIPSTIAFIIVVLGFIIMSIVNPLKANAQWVTVSGTVRIYQTSQPLPNTTIRCDILSTTTNANGNYVLGVPLGGFGDLIPEKEGYRFVPESIYIEPLTENLPNQNFSAILSVTDIINIPTTAVANIPLYMPIDNNIFVPYEANQSYPSIVWSMVDPGSANATLTHLGGLAYRFLAENEGVTTIRATIQYPNEDGSAYIIFPNDFVKDFTINVISANLSISGNPVFGQTLTVNHSNFSMWPYEIIKYGWKRNGTIIDDYYLTVDGGNSKTYTLTADDIGKEIAVTIYVGDFYDNSGGYMALKVIGSMTSSPTATVTKATQTAPPTPTLQSKTPTSITLNTVEGCEYQKDNGNWQSSNVFNGLTPNTSYTFKQRKKETATHLASPPSNSATFKTDEQNGNIYTITATVNNADWGTIDPFGDAKVEEGGNITFTIAPKTNYVIDNVLVNGESKGAITTYTFTNVQSNGTISAVFKIGVGVTENEIEKLVVYPNPTNGELYIQTDEVVKFVEVFNIEGRKILQTEIRNNSLNISHLSVGVYMVKVHTDIGIRTVKVVKQ